MVKEGAGFANSYSAAALFLTFRANILPAVYVKLLLYTFMAHATLARRS